jgi:hypothetical protein
VVAAAEAGVGAGSRALQVTSMQQALPDVWWS